MNKTMRRLTRPNLLPVVLLFAAWVFLPSASQAGDLTVDNLNVYKDATVYGNLKVIQGNVPGFGSKLYYSFDTAPTGGVVADESANANSGTVYGVGTIWTNVSGLGAGSFYFNNSGVGNYVQVNYGASLQLTGVYTLAAWIKPEVPGDAGAPGIIGKANGSSSEYGLMWASGGAVAFISSGSDSLSYMWTTNGVAPVGVWKHVVGVLEGSGTNQAKIYVNGSVILQGQMRLPSAGGDPLYIGRWRDEYYYKGCIDEPRIFDRALSATEVQRLYSNTCPTGVVLQVDDSSVLLTGDLSVQSNLSAASFSGSGSGLTGISGGSISAGTISNSQLAPDVLATNNARYVDVTGDTMTGTLTLNAATALSTTGNVGIGTTPTTNKLEVSGAAQVTSIRVIGTSGSYIERQGDISMGTFTNGL